MRSDFPLRLTGARKVASAALCLVLSAFGFPGELLAQTGRTAAPPAVLGPAPSAPPAIALPAVQSVSPAMLHAGSTVELMLSGSGLNPRSLFSFGDGVEVLGPPQAAGSGQLRLTVRVAPNAMPGLRTVRVATGNLSGQGPATVTVIAGQGRGATSTAVGAQGSGTGMLPPPPALQPPAPERQIPPPRPAAPPPTAAQPVTMPPVGPVATTPSLPPPMAKLAFGLPVVDKKKPAWGSTELLFDKNTAPAKLVWETTQPGSYQWRWQIAAQSFPAGGGMPPSGLLDEGEAAYDHFALDLTSYIPAGAAAQPSAPKIKLPPAGKGGGTQGVATMPAQNNVIVNTQTVFSTTPATFHIRLAAFQDGKAAGPVSNAVTAHYQPGSTTDGGVFKTMGEEQAKLQQAKALLDQAKKVFELKILSFRPAIFPDPNRWGCIVVASNPYFGNFPHPLAGYKPGKEYCPPIDPSTQQKSTADWVWEGVKGYGKAWDGLAGVYNGAKSWLAAQFAEAVPCEWLGKKYETKCEDAVEQLAGYAISAGLVALGVPPSLPDLSALTELGKGKAADAAVEFSCQTFESYGGECTPKLREQLRKFYKMALDELQKKLAENLKHEAHEPGCGDAQTAGEHGRLPLPCFTDFAGAAVKPATGSVYEPPQVRTRVTRKTPQPNGVTGCDSLAVDVLLENQFEGGMLSGKMLPPAKVSGAAYKTEVAAIPKLAVGKSVEIALNLNHMAKVDVPGNYWPDFYLPNWLVLYEGGKGTLSAGVLAQVESGTASGKLFGSCATGDSWSIQIPK